MAAKSASPDAAQVLREVGLTNLPSKWAIVRIEDLLSYDRGISVGVMYPGEHDPAGVPLIKSGDLSGDRINPKPAFRVSAEKHHEYRRTALTGGELLISLVGDVGRCAIVGPEMVGWNAARAIAVLRFARPGDAAFARACLLSEPLQHLMQAWSTTTVQATLNLKEIRQLPLPWPPKPERAAIVQALGALDAKIDLCAAMNQTSETMARTMFKDWFVDFGPTRAKGEGRAPYLRSELWGLFPGQLDVNERPEGWISGALADVAHQVGQIVNPETVPPTTPYIGLEHMPRRSVSLRDWEGAGKVTSGKSAFKRGDVLFGKLRPYFHKVGIAPIDGICSTDIVVLNAKMPEAHSFVVCCISEDSFVAFTERTSDGTKMPRTSWEKMGRYGLALPPSSVLEAFENLTSPLFVRVLANIHESRTLLDVRDALIPKLVSGEIRVRTAERMAEAVL